MKLSLLAKAAAPYVLSLSEDCRVGAVSADSRLKTQDGLFFCIKGARADGHKHAGEAVQNGAARLMVTELLPDIGPAAAGIRRPGGDGADHPGLLRIRG